MEGTLKDHIGRSSSKFISCTNQVIHVNIIRGAVLKVKRGVDANGEELSQHFT